MNNEEKTIDHNQNMVNVMKTKQNQFEAYKEMHTAPPTYEENDKKISVIPAILLIIGIIIIVIAIGIFVYAKNNS